MRVKTMLVAGVILATGAFGCTQAMSQASEFQDRYLISVETYKKVTPARYVSIYKSVKRKDTSAAHTMKEAAREYCVIARSGEFDLVSMECVR